jgi:hypothetical protein
MASIINAATSGGLISTGDTSGQLQLQTAGTTAVTINSSQQVLFNTTTNTFSAYGAFSEFRKDQNSASYVTIQNQNAGSSGSAGLLLTAYGNSWVNSIGSNANNTNALTWAVDATSPSIKMTLDTSGKLGLGTTSPTTSIYINGAPSTASITIQRTDEGGYGGRVGCGNTIFGPATARSLGLDGYSSVNFGIAGVQRMYLDSNGALYLTVGTFITGNVTPLTAASVASNAGTAAVWDGSGNLYKLASSLRYKENITDWTVTDEQLNAFVNLNPKLWDYIGKENGCAGFIAEDIEALGLKNAYNTSPLINYSSEGLPDSNRDFALIALQHKVLQKLQQSIQELSTQVTELKAEVQALKGA